MSKDYITTNELIEFLTKEGYRAIETRDSYGNCIEVHEGAVPVGSVRTDALYVLKVSACLTEDYRERLLGILYAYAKTPIESRKDKMYTLRISETNLYIAGIDGTEMIVVSDESKAKLYSAAGMSKAKELAKGHHTVLKEGRADATN